MNGSCWISFTFFTGELASYPLTLYYWLCCSKIASITSRQTNLARITFHSDGSLYCLKMDASSSLDTSITTDTIIEKTNKLKISSVVENKDKNNKDNSSASKTPPLLTKNTPYLEHGTGAPSQQTSTKVYYHIDDEMVPYCTDVMVPPDKITLGDFKRVLTRSNFKYYCKAPAPDSGVFPEVKVEIRDDSECLYRSANGQFELFLLTSEGSSHSDGSSGLPLKSARLMCSIQWILIRSTMSFTIAPTMYPIGSMAYRQALQQFDQIASTDSDSFISDMRALPMQVKGVTRRPFQQQYLLQGHRSGRRFEDSTLGSESDARLFSDDDDRSRVSTSTDITSVSRQHHVPAYRKRRNRRRFRQPSRASSFSSITESSMSLDVITVTLNMDTVNFLGISIVGQSSSRGDNGIYVANIMKGGAVALDGRIEPGDMILQVNDISFENFTNDQAVDVLRESVARRGPIKLTVAKMWDSGPRSAFTVPRHRDEPVRPIDTQAWIQHTNAMRGMPSILEGSEGAPTPIPGQYGRPAGSSTATSNGSIPNTIVGGAHFRLDAMTDKKKIVQMMVMPNSGLDIKNRTWLKIPIPMSFLGSDLVDWLMEHVDGLRDRKDGRKFAGELLKEKLISHVVNKITFTEQCYYILGEECADYARLRQNPGGDDGGVRSEVGSVLPPPPPGLVAAAAAQQSGRIWPQPTIMPQSAPSMISGYASMPMTLYPIQQPYIASTNVAVPYKSAETVGGGPDVHSQTSSNDGSSGSEQRRGRAILPPAPMSSAVHSTTFPSIIQKESISLAADPSFGMIPTNRLEKMPQDLVSSRQSFRIAMSQPFEFFVDNL
ncbi:Segment polarity protein dishevelled [Dirofilaria immitis]